MQKQTIDPPHHEHPKTEFKSTVRETRSPWIRKFDTAARMLGVVAFIFSCVELWSTLSSASDAKLATRLAEWTTLKDFLEFCESVSGCLLKHGWKGALKLTNHQHDLNTTDCQMAQGMALNPPPGFPATDRRRSAPGWQVHTTMPVYPASHRKTVAFLSTYPVPFLIVILRRFALRIIRHRTKSLVTQPGFERYGRVQRRDHRSELTDTQSDRECPKAPSTWASGLATTPTSGQGTGTRLRKPGFTGIRRRRGGRADRILRNRVKTQHAVDEMDDSSSDELLYTKHNDPRRPLGRYRRRMRQQTHPE